MAGDRGQRQRGTKQGWQVALPLICQQRPIICFAVNTICRITLHHSRMQNQISDRSVICGETDHLCPCVTIISNYSPITALFYHTTNQMTQKDTSTTWYDKSLQRMLYIQNDIIWQEETIIAILNVILSRRSSCIIALLIESAGLVSWYTSHFW